MDTKLKEAQQLCKDLEYLCSQDDTLLEYIIDEYVYLLSDKRFEEMQEYVKKELEADYQMKFTSNQYRFALMFIQGVTIVLVTHIVMNGGM